MIDPAFYNSIEEYKMERLPNGQQKPKYMTIERFERFVSNEFWHVKQYARWSLWVSLAILVAIIARFILGG